MKGAACFDPSGQYRYWLSRDWAQSGLHLTVVMLNPSRADAERNDPTLRRCLGLAQSWGYSRLTVVNLFAYCSAYPQQLWQVQDPVGPDNDRHLLAACDRADRVLLAWGNWGGQRGRDRAVLTECIPVLQVCPHPPTPSPKTGEGEPKSKSLSRSGRGI